MFARKVNGELALTDFVNVYNAALLTKRCLSHKVDIYDPLVQAQSQEAITAPLKPDKPFYLQYPPYFFSLMLPLAVFNVSGAWCAWSLLGMICLLGGLRYLASDCEFSKLERTAMYATVLTSYPVWLCFGMGQTALPNYAAVVAFWCFLRQRNYFKSGLAAAIIAIKMQYLAVVGVVGLVVGQFAFVAGLAVLLSTMTAYSIAVLGLDNVLAFPHALLQHESSANVSGVSPVTMQNIRGYLLLTTHADARIVFGISVLMLAMAVTALVIAWHRWTIGAKGQLPGSKRNEVAGTEVVGTEVVGANIAFTDPLAETSRMKPDRVFKYLASLTIPLLLITSLHTHVYDYVLMTIPSIWLWDLMRTSEASDKLSRALRILIFTFWPATWIFAQFRDLLSSMYIQPAVIWALAVFIIAMRIFLRELGTTKLAAHTAIAG